MNTAASLYHHPYSNFRYDPPRFNAHMVSVDSLIDDEGQIPSSEEFNEIIDNYLNNLSPKKRDKALVNQHRYCLIQQVLRDPRNTAISTAQFRFWVKKMFQLQPGSDIVCHDNKPVATKEQIYDILVKAHREAQHGGRDKTSALVRRKFSWIPKELVARFVRHCPFCITRRSNGSHTSLLHKSPSSRYAKHGYSFDSNQYIRTPSSFKEGSDISESGYEATPVTYSSSPSPKKSYLHEREEPDYLSFEFFNNRPSPNLTLAPPQPHSPLFYQSYSLYNTNYYPIEISSSPGAAVAVAAASTTAATAAAAAALMSPSTDLLSHQNHYSTTSDQSNTRSNHFPPYHHMNMPENVFSNAI